MLTIAVLNQKGGVGKSTLATNLAAAAHLKRRRVLVVDLDAQGSAFDWYAARSSDGASKLEGLTVVKADRALSLARFREMSKGFDVVVLDGPPKLGDLTRAAAVAADVVLVPVQPGPFDLWSAGETGRTLDAADELRAELGRPPVRRLHVLNCARRTRLTDHAVEVFRSAGSELVASIHQRTAFAEAAAIGESVLTTEPSGPAADEIRHLYARIAR
jgi:chromosome partitioning protein